MASLLSFVNSLIPFADPSRPLWRDILLSLVLCTVLYAAPQTNWSRVRSALSRQHVETHQPQNDRVEDARIPNDIEPEQANHDIMQEDIAHAEEDPLDAPDAAPVPVHAPAEQRAGPANPPAHQPRPRDPTREVGAKKAKAIARRNQQRAYNEFMRERGDQQRAEWASTEKERNEEIRIEKERRAAIEARVKEKERKEREARKAKEEAQKLAEIDATRKATSFITGRLAVKGIVSLREVESFVNKDAPWVGQLLQREGLLGEKRDLDNNSKIITMHTRSDWIVRLDTAAMNRTYRLASEFCDDGDGAISWPPFGRLIQKSAVSG